MLEAKLSPPMTLVAQGDLALVLLRGKYQFCAMFLEKLGFKVEQLVYLVVGSLHFCFRLHEGLGVIWPLMTQAWKSHVTVLALVSSSEEGGGCADNVKTFIHL